MAEQVRQANAEARRMAATGEGGNPDDTEITAQSEQDGVTPDDDAAGNKITDEANGAEAADDAAEASGADGDDEETLIRIGDKTFKTEAAALAYAEQAEREREIERAHTLGVREAIEALKPAPAPAKEEEDDFDAKFYTDPKAALEAVRTRATADAVAQVRTEIAREGHWTSFLNDHPDIDRKDAERILQENWDTLGKMTFTEGRKELARATRAEYQRIIDRLKPRTELPNNRGQSLAAGQRVAPKSVTPQREEKPLDFVSQLKKLKTQR